MRRAEWRRSPSDPTTAREFLKRWPAELYTAQTRYEAINMALFLPFWLMWLFLIPALPMLGGSEIVIRYGWGYGILAFLGIVGLEFSIAFLANMSSKGPPAPPPERRPSTLDRLATLPATEATYPVRVSIRYRGALTGTDEAIASFTDGWLFIEGTRMSCVLTSGDGRGVWRKGQLWIDLPDDGSLTLRRVDSPNFPQKYYRSHHGHFGRDFKEDAEDWLEAEPPTEGMSALPPLLTHWTMRRGWNALITASLILTTCSLVLLPHASGFLREALLTFALVGGWGFARGLVVRRRQDEVDRRRWGRESTS